MPIPIVTRVNFFPQMEKSWSVLCVLLLLSSLLQWCFWLCVVVVEHSRLLSRKRSSSLEQNGPLGEVGGKSLTLIEDWSLATAIGCINKIFTSPSPSLPPLCTRGEVNHCPLSEGRHRNEYWLLAWLPYNWDPITWFICLSPSFKAPSLSSASKWSLSRSPWQPQKWDNIIWIICPMTGPREAIVKLD